MFKKLQIKQLIFAFCATMNFVQANELSTRTAISDSFYNEVDRATGQVNLYHLRYGYKIGRTTKPISDQTLIENQRKFLKLYKKLIADQKKNH